jgi:hypothetical protein
MGAEMKKQGYRGSWSLIAGLLLAGAACAYGTGTASDTWRAEEPAGAVQLNVTNLYNGPMEIYAIGSGTSYRIGLVNPGLTSTFVVRPVMIVSGSVEFVARAGSGIPPARSGRMLLAPGNIVDFKLDTSPWNSVATVRP